MEILSWLLMLTILLLTLLLTVMITRKQAHNLPPGPPKLPFIGNLHQLLLSKTTLAHRRLAELAREHGPIMHLQLGEVLAIVISSAEMAKEAMTTHDTKLCSRPALEAARALLYECSDIALSPYGEYWRQVRKIAVFELFTKKRVESFRSIREEEVANVINELSLGAGLMVNLSEKLFGLTFDIFSRVAFKERGNEQAAFRAMCIAASEVISDFSVSDVFPSNKFLCSLSSRRKKKLDALAQEANRLLEPIIGNHLYLRRCHLHQPDASNMPFQSSEHIPLSTHEKEEEDLVDVLLKFHKPEDANIYDEFYLTSDNIKAIILELFVAGSETSSTIIEWAMAELLRSPKAMEKAQLEVRRLYKGNGVIEDTRLDELKYLKQVIKETLRLHPPLPLLIPRESLMECQIQSYNIPPKTQIMINAWAIGRDPTYWTDPETFSPERFDNSSVDYKGSHFELIPFGGGRRQCPGIALGIANIELPLAMLLYHFDWKLPPELERPKDLNMDESPGVARRKHELHVIPISYPNQGLR